MGLREIAKADNLFILSGDASGFRWPLQVTNPAGVTMGVDEELYGFSNDIGQVIDPDTGMAVSGRSALVTIHTQTLLDFFGATPIAIADPASKPWIIRFDDINGEPHTFKVSGQSMPDRALGLITMMLELYDGP